MNIDDQSDAFTFELDNLISRFSKEFDLNPFTLAGILEQKKLDLLVGTDVEFEADEDIWEDPDNQ
tara:strand:+ start:1204 stop:1398 length:195 start_codon:yes stop_codon:yes gene_type:complete